VIRSCADEHGVSASSTSLGVGPLVLGFRRALLVRVTAAGTTAVELDALTGAGDSVALARARGGEAVGGGAGAAGRGRGEGRAVRVDVRVVVGVFLLGRRIVEVGVAQAAGNLFESSLLELSLDDGLGLTGTLGTRRLDVAGSNTTTGGDLARVTARGTLAGRRAVAGRSLGLAGGNIEDVELAAGGWLDGVLLGWIVRDVVSVHHVVVPVALTLLEDGRLEAESSSPGT